ncbi:MAG: hypothetical protein K2X49_27860 [Acetobacteraceae bacterium]|nr:hypothetical protein [Acetobacteraceae bacterium]
MRTLFLHVGMHKTGTTSIQQTLHAHQAALREAGLSWFADAEPNHSRVVFSAFTGAPHLYHVNRRHGLHRPADAAQHAAESRARLTAFLHGAPGPGLILSGEDIGMLGEAPIRRMLAAFRPHVERIVVIGMVRPPRGFIASAIQQRIRGGALLDGIEDGGVMPHYRARFEPFLTAPEVAETRLHLYTPATLDGGCSVATFLRLVGAPAELYPRLAVVRANGGASRLGVVLSLAANRAVPIFRADGSANPERAARLVRFLDGLEGARFAAPAALVAPRLARAAEDVAWMERQLGTPFSAAETAIAGTGMPEPGLDSLSGDELDSLVRGLNGLFRELEEARAARRRDGPEAPSRTPTAEQEARRAARRAQRQQEGRAGWR